MDNLLHWLGWRPRVAFGLGATLGIALYIASNSVAMGLVGLMSPLGLWVWSTKSINQNWTEMIDKLKHEVEVTGQQWLHLADGEFRSFVLITESGTSPLITPRKTYTFACIYVTPILVGTYNGSTYDAVSGTLKPGTDTREVYLKQIAGVDYRPPQIEVKTVAGEPFNWSAQSEAMAKAIVGQIRGRLRAAHA